MLQVKLHKGQIQVASDQSRFRVVCAGRRWGKSVLSQLIVLKWATEKVGLYWIVSPTYRQGKQIHWRGLQQIIPKDWIAKKNEVELSITLKNGSIIELKGSENPDALRGVKLRGLVIDEIASIRNWDWLWDEALRPTLTDYEAPAIFISTPKGFNHFFKLYEEGQNTDSQYKSWRFSSYDNPYIPKAEIDQAKVELGIDTFSQEYLAEFTRFTGLIYKEFDADQEVHYFDHEFNQYGDYYYGLDFAVRGWTACILALVKPDGHIYYLDSYKEEAKTAKGHAQAIKEMMKQYAPFEKWIGYGDPAGFAKNQQSMEKDMIWSLADEYLEEGFQLVPANNEVLAGINFVRQLHKDKKIHIHPRCQQYVDEKVVYQWKEQSVAQQSEHSAPEMPRKINDHLMDAERYLCFSKPVAPDEQEVKTGTVFPIKFPPPTYVEDRTPKEDEDQITPIDIPSMYD